MRQSYTGLTTQPEMLMTTCLPRFFSSFLRGTDDSEEELLPRFFCFRSGRDGMARGGEDFTLCAGAGPPAVLDADTSVHGDASRSLWLGCTPVSSRVARSRDIFIFLAAIWA